MTDYEPKSMKEYQIKVCYELYHTYHVKTKSLGRALRFIRENCTPGCDTLAVEFIRKEDKDIVEEML